jgi:16S rRNA (guanine527-N7)-methyltransferase
LSALPPAEGAAGDVMALCAPLGLAPCAEQAQTLHDFMGLLARWNGVYNLTAVRDPAAMRVQHLADCLAVVPPLARHSLATRGDIRGRLLDVGSGGGLPGVVIATLLPGWDVTCVDAVGKKAAFVRQVAGDLGLKNLHAAHSRVEALKAPAFDVVTSRAFATLADFVKLTRPLLAVDGVWLAMKGQRPDAEIADLPPDVEVFHVEQLHVPQLDAQRCLVWMRLR